MALLLGSTVGALAQPAPAAVPAARQFSVGALNRLDELPASPFRARLEQLPATARGRALQWLRSFHFPEADVASLHVDDAGGICYVCEFSLPALTEPGGDELEAPPIGQAAVPVSPFPSSLIFHSRPGAANVLYLNFAGENVVNTEWNTVVGRSEIPALAFSSDTDYSTFSDSEQAAIKRIWQRVAEDYAPFNINVTTERPASFNNRTALALITRKTDANGAANPYNSGGGVAYVNVFGTSSYANYRPAWIYHDNLSNGESFIAEAVSHEIGHNLGLSHDGTSSSDYYGGHGSGDISWGPIMGTGYNRNVSQWSKGEYYQANNTQDDLATIAGKLSYRTDDHGGTPGTATALVITGGTNLVATTPENDPANANAANKGVLDRNTDVDVFSFVTGNGPVRLAVNPWIMPSGTRGGNVDLQIELYNEGGSLLATSNPASQTTALIETSLAEGRYYLHVRNSAAGDPFSSTPTGYTAYASLGQYFISGYVTEADAFIVPPLAEVQLAELTQAGQSSYQFTVTYSDDVAIDVATIDSSDLRVTGPNGYDQFAQFISLNTSGNGTPRIATYAVTPPGGGTWSPTHNGTYTVAMQATEVADTQGAYVAAGELGQFQVAVATVIYFASLDTDPGWALQPDWQYGPPTYTSGGPTNGYTGTNIIGYNLGGNYPNNLSVKYATTPAINTSGSTSLTLRFQRWLRTRNNDTASIQASADGVGWVDVWSTSSPVADTGWQSVQYPLPAGVVGGPTVYLRWGLASNPAQNDIGWHLDDVELLGNGALDTEPPVAVLSVANVPQGGSPSHACSVTYTDATAVRLASLDSTDLLVTGPNGYSNVVEFIGADLPMDGSPITGSYSIPAPDGSAWNATDNGTYTVTLLAGAVEDTLNNFTPQTTLGNFDVAISAATPGVLVVASNEELDASGPVGGPFSPDAISYTLRNTGETALNWTAGNTAGWVSLSATSGSLAAGASAEVTVSLNAGATSLAAGDYTDAVNFVNTTTGSGNTSRGVSLTVNTVGFLAVASPEELAASGPVGGPFSPDAITYTLSNSGETALNWTASKTAEWVSLSATSGSLAAGASAAVIVSLNAGAASLAAGDYTDAVSFVNTTTGSGNTSRNIQLSVLPLVNLALEVNAAERGTVSPGHVSHVLGSTVELLATPATYFEFQGWSGDVTGSENPKTLTMDADKYVVAAFGEILTTNHPTPLWWLAEQGYPGDFEAAVEVIGSNGLPLWQSYIAGLDPANPASVLRLDQSLSPTGAEVILQWSPVAGRLYTIWSTHDLGEPFSLLAGATDLAAEIHSFTASLDSSTSPRYYRLEVRKP